jgi:hypothetical protein
MIGFNFQTFLRAICLNLSGIPSLKKRSNPFSFLIFSGFGKLNFSNNSSSFNSSYSLSSVISEDTRASSSFSALVTLLTFSFSANDFTSDLLFAFFFDHLYIKNYCGL